MKPRRLLVLTLAALLAFPAVPALAWNDRGHKLVALIAWNELDPATRTKVIKALKEHPAFKNGDWTARVARDPGSDADASLFLFAAVFPDDAKRDTDHGYDQFDDRDAHFINFPFIPRVQDRTDPTIRVKDPHLNQNIVRAFGENVRDIKSASTTAEDKAVALSWVFHLVGDVHQPLHSTALYSKKFPRGDQGGNLIRVHNQKLHGHWDGLLGNKTDFASLSTQAKKLATDHPRASLGALDGIFEAWALESFALAKSTAYGNLDPMVSNSPDFPVGYEADAHKVADRRVTMAGYRLADQLREMFP